MHEMSIEGVQLRYRLIEMEKLIEQSMRVRNQSITRQDHNRYEMIPSASSHSLPDTNMSHSSGIASIKRPKTPPKKMRVRFNHRRDSTHFRRP
ncbi:unnamed protein product, partial [Mesorhabditis belari]|uniref:Uncharacterized protein n=1 Tax=Mesorhabditis belari TaxID=2138241 RepID=A0AAF3FBP6_9BILA